MAKRARNGAGNIRPRKLANGDTVYDAAVSVKDPMTGKSVRLYKRGFSSHADASEWVRTQQASRLRRSDGMTLDDLARLYWESGGIKETTKDHWISWYKADIQEYLGQVPVSEILPMHIDSWVGKIRAKKQRKASTLVNRVTVLSNILNYGVINRLVEADWTKSSPAVRRLRTEASNQEVEEKEIWTPEQFQEFLTFEPEPSYKALWCFFAATGTRRGTACGLRWPYVDFDKDIITLGVNRTVTPQGVVETTPKGGRKQKLVMDDLLRQVLEGQKERQERLKAEGPWEDHGVVFDRPLLTTGYKGKVFVPGRPMEPKAVTERFRRLVEYAGLPPASPHDLRHMWATLARDSGASRDAVADQLGHSSKAVIKAFYDHSDVEARNLASLMSKTLLG